MLRPGNHVGSYEILGPLGAGGMGEVYRALDAKLNREVAVKVLHEGFGDDSARLRRFKSEAKVVARISHPNVLAVYDSGEDHGAPFLVTELLDGSTLRARLTSGRLPIRRALEIGSRLAHGLAAAHEKGIVHRDVKPENVFLCRDGNVKLLDFGIAHFDEGQAATGTLALTNSGAVVGTAGYMAPEQVRGQVADARSDIFALGAVLYEMVAGARAFEGAGPIERAYAILNAEPAALLSPVPPALEKLMRRCLEKAPAERFQSVLDVAFALETIADNPSGPMPALQRRSRLRVAGMGLGLMLLIGVGAALWKGRAAESAPRFTPLTFRRGPVRSARFVPEGQTIVYSAGWEGTGEKLYSMNLKSIEPVLLGLEGLVLAASSTDELLVLLTKVMAPGYGPAMLARVGVAGQTPRELLKGVKYADWAPDGSGPAVVRVVSGRERLEFPIGNVLFESVSGEISNPRFSPQGDAIAFFENKVSFADAGDVVWVDLSGHKRTLAAGFSATRGLAWSPSGAEVWFGAEDATTGSVLRAVTPAGAQRLLVQVPGILRLFDVDKHGRMLVSRDDVTMSTVALRSGEHRERDLSWYGFSALEDLSADGETVVFGDSVGRGSMAFLRKTDGAPPVRLGPGDPSGISPDGKWVLSITGELDPHIFLLPTGEGTARSLASDGVRPLMGRWLPDGSSIIIAGHAPGHADRLYSISATGGALKPVTPEGIDARDWAVAADGTVAAIETGWRISLFPVNGPPTRLPRFPDFDRPIAFSPDGAWLYMYTPQPFPCRISRLNLATGKNEPWKVVAAQDTTGVSYCSKVRVTPDGRGYAYRYLREFSTLYLLEGLH